MGGQFNNKNAGKRGISLNIRHPKGLQIAKDLVRICDVVAEGFSPGVLQRLGLEAEQFGTSTGTLTGLEPTRS